MDADKIPALLALASNKDALAGAKMIAGFVVHGDTTNQQNTCAATLSFLLDGSGIPVGMLEAVLDLAPFLSNDRKWSTIDVNDEIKSGDVGVFEAKDGTDIHHMYVVIDATHQESPVVADNQGPGSHPRPIKGGPMPGVGNDASATTFLLRAT